MNKKIAAILALLFLSATVAFSQNIQVKGTVIDANGDPVPFASIQLKGTKTGTSTDENGNYTFSAPKNGTLIFSSIGYQTNEVHINGKLIVDCVLNQDTDYLDDVVVVAYGVAKKESIVGAVSQVNSKDIEKRSTSSVSAVLEGSAPGIRVNNSYGEPGSDASIRIRGFGSINGTNAPLYVMDGVVYGGNISDLNPQDIESISVLKDASSAALYGNRASNGVILITTKKGKDGKVSLTANINQGVYQRGIREYDSMNADEWMETMWTTYRNGMMSDPALNKTLDEATALARKDFLPVIAKYNIYNKGDEELFDANGKLTGTVKPLIAEDLDWFKPIERLGYRQEYNMSANAASEKSSFYLSAAYLDEKGYVKSSDFSRFNGRANVSVTPRKWIKVGMNLAGSYQESNFTDTDGNNSYINPFYYSRFMAPIYPVHQHDLSSANGDYILDGAGNKQYDDGNSRGQNENRHIAWELEDNLAKSYRTTLNGQLYADIKFLKDFTFSIKGDMSLRNSEAQTYNNALIGDGAGSNGRASRTIYRYMNYTFQQQLTWQRAFGEHNVDALLGHENYYYHYNYLYNYKTNQTFPGQTTLNNFSEMTTMTDYYNDVRSESYLARARYNFANKYFAEASFRRDGSSRFHPDHRWGNFWSVGGSWVLSNEDFIKAIPQINSLKFRASYGEVGNDQGVGYYAYMALYAMVQNGGKGGAYKSQNDATNIKWETAASWSAALEGRFFDCWNLSLEYYDKRTRDLLFSVYQPLSAGATSTSSAVSTITQNLGSVSNKGIEIATDFDVIRTKDFKWNLNMNATIERNKIITLPQQNREEGILSGNFKYAEGHSMYEFFTYQYEGVDMMTGRCLYQIDDEAFYVGTPAEGETRKPLPEEHHVNINGKDYTTYVTYAKRDWSGCALPKIYGSFGTSFSYKNFSLSALFTYSLGGKMYDSSYASLMSASTNVHQLHRDLLGSWTAAPAGMTETSSNRINPDALPGLNSYYNQYNSSMSTRWLQSSNYLVFKNLTVSYNIPSRITRMIDIAGASVNFSAENLFTMTTLRGMNPQQNFTGDSSNKFTTARVFSLGLNIRL